MIEKKFKKSFIRLLFIASISVAPALAVDQQKQLSHIAEQIQNIKSALQEKNKKRDALQKDLNKIDTQYGENSKNLQEIEQQITEQKTQITNLESNALINKGQIQAEQKALANQLRLAYFSQREYPLKLLLSQEDPSGFSRSLIYYQAFNDYRIEKIQQSRQALQKIFNRQKKIYAQYKNLQKLQEKQQEQQKTLEMMKVGRTQLITEINQTISDQNQRLAQLFSNKKRLEQTLAHLSRLKTVITPAHYSSKPFYTLQGRLPWPTRGNVLHYFDTPIEQSELKWMGELIEAPDEQPVYAVAGGTVVFAKWLEGYGLLLIINHGQGYMTLYGRNHSLYKREGTPVKAGELIATVGQSGGYSKPALYFAILHNAKPLNPNRWCAGP